MKKILTLVLVLILALTSMVSCDKKIKLPFDLPFDLPFVDNGEENNDDKNNITYDLAAAAEFVRTLYVEKTVATGDYEVIAQAMVAGVKYTIDWTVDNTEKVKLTKGETKWTVDIDSRSDADYNYTLTATITAGDGTTTTVTFPVSVKKYEVVTFEQYMAAKKGDVVTVEGIVVAMCSKDAGAKRNHVYVADASGVGGYFNYNMEKDPVKDLGIQVGMTVKITGEISPSNGMQEFYQGSVEIIDSTIKQVPANDITAAFAAGEKLDNYVARLVTIKGVTIGTQALTKDTDQYLYFRLNKVKSYIRTYVTDFPSTLKEADKATIDGTHAEKFDWTANVTGILVYYSSAPYLIPVSVDCFEYLSYVEKTPAQKVDTELDDLTFDASFGTDKVVDLPTTGEYYEGITFSWASDNAAITISEDGTKATIKVPENETIVKLTVTAKLGDQATNTKEFSVKLSKTLTSITDAVAIAKKLTDKGDPTTDKYLVAGVITKIVKAEYGNMYIQDAAGNELYIYGLYSADGSVGYKDMTSKPAVGDYIVVNSVIGHYNEPQLKNAWLVSCTTPTTIPAAKEVANTLTDKGDPTAIKYLVTGEITEIKNATYGNVYIKDADGNTIYVYGLYSEDGKVAYKDMANKPAVGDIITVLGVISLYNEPQVKNAWVLVHAKTCDHVDANGDFKCDNDGCDEILPPEDGATLTIAQALALGALYKNDTTSKYTDGKYYVVGTIVGTPATPYGGCSITDGTNTIAVYGLRDATGTYKYSLLDNAIAEGTSVKLYGKIGAYKQDVQMDNSAVEGATHTHSYSTATCTKAPTCACGDVNGTTIDHTYVNGECSCGAKSGEVTVTLDIPTKATEAGWTNGTQYTEVAIDANITVTVEGGSNSGKYYTSGTAWRMYFSEDPSIIIAAAEGKVIVSVTIKYTSYQTGVITNGEAQVASEATVTVNGNTITFGVTDTDTSDGNGQARIISITVVYKDAPATNA